IFELSCHQVAHLFPTTEQLYGNSSHYLPQMITSLPPHRNHANTNVSSRDRMFGLEHYTGVTCNAIINYTD
ncbi:MAG: hypothetical protein PHU24_12045, partial [Sphaerochaetaceae bacterium]|nr:hypothetical protein [Sphaerochaetaceae bacterium]